MNHQEQGYTPPGTQYGDPRPFNTDPREQPGFVSQPFNTDPREQPQWQAAPPMAMMPPRRKHGRGYWFIVGTLILAVIFGGFALTGLALARTITETKQFTVGDSPTLVLTNSDGSVHLVSGPARQITVVAHKHTFAGNEDQLQVNYQQSSDDNTITVSSNDRSSFNFVFFINLGIDFDVTVPSQTNLNVETSNGSVDADGITGHGQITLKSENGSLSTNGGSGQVTLTTSNGSVKASNVSGQITLATSNGSIEADNASLSGDSTFETSDGSISFSGSLAPSSSNSFRTSNGSIDVTLPADASFRVSSHTSNGSLNSDFDGTTNGAYGNPPYAVITLLTSNGSISIHRA